MVHYLSGAYVRGLPYMDSYGGQGYRAPLAEMVWAADNGCFARPGAYSDDGYLAWLDARPRNALFACAPDIVGDWTATLSRALPLLAHIRALGFRAALVLQDGATVATVPWEAADAVFVGGSTAWKLGPTVPCLTREARARGLWTHMGRVNNWQRYRLAAAIGCQSVDGNLVAFGRDRWTPHVKGYALRLAREPMLWWRP